MLFQRKKEIDIHSLAEAFSILEKKNADLEKRIADLEKKSELPLQKIAVVRFTSLSGGGNQSFSAAILDENGNGLVITSLYGHEQSRIFAKPVRNGKSRYTLLDEEKDAISQAMKGLEEENKNE